MPHDSTRSVELNPISPDVDGRAVHAGQSSDTVGERVPDLGGQRVVNPGVEGDVCRAHADAPVVLVPSIPARADVDAVQGVNVEPETQPVGRVSAEMVKEAVRVDPRAAPAWQPGALRRRPRAGCARREPARVAPGRKARDRSSRTACPVRGRRSWRNADVTGLHA